MGDLKNVFDPKNIALIGATDREGTIVRIILANLLAAKHRRIFPIHRSKKTLLGLACYPSITDIAEPVDLAIITTPARFVPGAVEECGRAGAEGVLIISPGFKETGEEGMRLEAEIDRIGKEYGMRVIGPNCLGFVRPPLGLNATFLEGNSPPGDIAFISQSSALGSAIFDWAVRADIGFSMFVSLGSMIDVDFGDMIDFLGSDVATRSILVYMEGVGNARKFMSAARAFARKKPIIILKPGRFEESARAVYSHTGTMAGDDAVYEAAFKRVGAVRVGEIAELFDAAKVLDSRRLPAGPRLAVVTSAGGLGVMATDALIRLGGELAVLSEGSVEQLNAFLPPYWSKANPVDVLGDTTVERFAQALDICLHDPRVDGVLCIYVPMPLAPSNRVAQAVVDAAKKIPKPVIAAWMGARDVEEGRRIFVANDIPHYSTPEEAVRTYVNMCRYKRHLDQLYETPVELPTNEAPPKERLKEILKTAVEEGRTLLSNEESWEFLSTYGIPPASMQPVRDPQGGKCSAAKAYYPADIDYQLLLGAKKDKDFGSVILFGMGGAMAEFMKDFSIGLPPLNQTLAKMLMQDARVYGILHGFPGKAPADLEALEKILINFSNLIIDFPDIAEIDINPLIITNGEAMALHARIAIDANYIASNRSVYPHLVIAPYPTKYVTSWRLPDGTEAVLRPIRPEDEPAEREMLSSLSLESVRTRFFSGVRNVSHERLILYCNIDYDRDLALIAEVEKNGKKRMIGVARLIMNMDLMSGEAAFLVDDEFQGKRLGSKFVEMLLEIARGKGLREVRADVLSENERMINIFKRFGFTIRLTPGDSSTCVAFLKLTSER